MNLFAKNMLLLCTLICLSQCTWLKTSSGPTILDFSNWNLTSSQKDSLKIFLRQFENLKRENSRMKKLFDSYSLDMAKSQAEKENLLELNNYYRSELENVRKDLDYVEKQFISLEKGMQRGETKASAVAAQAEAKIMLDRLLRNREAINDTSLLNEAKEKFAKSEICLKNGQYAASIYYSKRAVRTFELMENIQRIGNVSGKMFIVSAGKVNVRKGPGFKFRVIRKLSHGTTVKEIEQRGDWIRVKIGDGKEGWVYANLMR